MVFCVFCPAIFASIPSSLPRSPFRLFSPLFYSSCTVHLYKCDAQRGSCGLCLKANPQFGCVWCKGENRCTLKQHCPHPENQWLEHNGINSKCTHPRITQVGTNYHTGCILLSMVHMDTQGQSKANTDAFSYKHSTLHS